MSVDKWDTIWILQERFESMSKWETFGVLDYDCIELAERWIAERPNARRMVQAENVWEKLIGRNEKQKAIDNGFLTAAKNLAV